MYKNILKFHHLHHSQSFNKKKQWQEKDHLIFNTVTSQQAPSSRSHQDDHRWVDSGSKTAATGGATAVASRSEGLRRSCFPREATWCRFTGEFVCLRKKTYKWWSKKTSGKLKNLWCQPIANLNFWLWEVILLCTISVPWLFGCRFRHVIYWFIVQRASFASERQNSRFAWIHKERSLLTSDYYRQM